VVPVSRETRGRLNRGRTLASKSLEGVTRERLVIYCQTTGVSVAHATHCATYCTPCRPLIRAFSGWIRTPPPTGSGGEPERNQGKMCRCSNLREKSTLRATLSVAFYLSNWSFNEQSTSATPIDCPWTQRLDGHRCGSRRATAAHPAGPVSF